MKKLAIKTTLCILVPVVIFLLVGCMKTPELNKDFGPKISAVEVNQALTSARVAATSTTINNILPGEFAATEKTNQIENIYPVVMLQKGTTVAARAEDPNKIEFVINHELKEFDATTGTAKDSTSQENACLEKVSGGCSAVASASIHNIVFPSAVNSLGPNSPPELVKFNERMKDLSLNAIVKNMAAAAPEQFTYHNLKKKEFFMPTPDLVKNRPNCGGRGTACNTPMKTYEVSFDEVDWMSEQYPVKYSYKLVFSPDAPFFSSLMSSCGATTIAVQSQRISFMQCEAARDFNVGSAQP